MAKAWVCSQVLTTTASKSCGRSNSLRKSVSFRAWGNRSAVAASASLVDIAQRDDVLPGNTLRVAAASPPGRDDRDVQLAVEILPAQEGRRGQDPRGGTRYSLSELAARQPRSRWFRRTSVEATHETSSTETGVRVRAPQSYLMREREAKHGVPPSRVPDLSSVLAFPAFVHSPIIHSFIHSNPPPVLRGGKGGVRSLLCSSHCFGHSNPIPVDGSEVGFARRPQVIPILGGLCDLGVFIQETTSGPRTRRVLTLPCPGLVSCDDRLAA